MANVIYLAKGERAPSGAIVIEVVGDRAAESLQSSPKGMTMKVKRSLFDDALRGMLAKVKDTPVAAIYVRGIPAP